MERFMYVRRLWKRVLGMHVIGQFFLTALLLASVGALVVACGNDKICDEGQEVVDGECKTKAKKADSNDTPATAKAEPGPSAPAPAADDLLKRADDVITLTLDGSKLYKKMSGLKLKSYDHLKIKFVGGWEIENGKVQTTVTSNPRSRTPGKHDVTACEAQVAEYEVAEIKVSIGEDNKSLILTFPKGSFEAEDVKQINETVDLAAEYGASKIQEEFTPAGSSTKVSTENSKACFRYLYQAQEGSSYEVGDDPIQAEKAPTDDALTEWNKIKSKKVTPSKDTRKEKLRNKVIVPRLQFFVGEDSDEVAFTLFANEVKYLLQVAVSKELGDKVDADVAEGKKGFKEKIEKDLVSKLVSKAGTNKDEFSRVGS